jgi:hypothetical protein
VQRVRQNRFGCGPSALAVGPDIAADVTAGPVVEAPPPDPTMKSLGREQGTIREPAANSAEGEPE